MYVNLLRKHIIVKATLQIVVFSCFLVTGKCVTTVECDYHENYVNNNIIWDILSLITTVWFLEVVICYEENRNDNTDCAVVFRFVHLRGDDLSV